MASSGKGRHRGYWMGPFRKVKCLVQVLGWDRGTEAQAAHRNGQPRAPLMPTPCLSPGTQASQSQLPGVPPDSTCLGQVL